MLLLILGLIVFLGIHLLPTAPDLRNGLATRLGGNGYQVAFAIVSFAGLALIVIGFGKAQMLAGSKNPILWDPPFWLRHVSFLLMLPAMVLIVAAYVPSRIRTAAKHPMLAAIKIWALAHLLANGDVASVLLFGSFLAWAVYDRISVKRRAALGPLGTKTGGLVGDLIALGGGAALWAFLLLGGHYWLIGVPLLTIGFAP
ncbi:MAG: NnrU family protein [Hyphomicrobiaceae bacterium]